MRQFFTLTVLTSTVAAGIRLSTPFLLAAPLLSGWPFLTLLAIGGLFLQSTLPVNVTFGQALAPVSAATVSSLMMGFAWGTGGLSAPLVGLLADRFGIERTLVGLACVPILAALCALPLPGGRGGVELRGHTGHGDTPDIELKGDDGQTLHPVSDTGNGENGE